MRAWMREVILPLTIGVAIIFGLIALGQYALNNVRDHERYRTHFADIQLTPPPGIERKQFLLDVQYESEMSSDLSILDESLPGKLKAAFEHNPWVETVEKVEILPTREIRVDLRYRVPVLRLRFRNGERVVDRHGVLLPRSAWSKSLPLFAGKVERPAGRTGTAWGDAQIEAVAKTVSFLMSESIALQGLTFDIDKGLVRIQTAKQTFNWGRPPGDEKTGEAKATIKVARLRDAMQNPTAPKVDLSQGNP